MGCGMPAHLRYRRRQQPQERCGLADRRDPQRRPETEQRSEHAAEEAADRQRAPHEEADAGVHPAEQPRWTDRLAHRDLVDVVRRAGSRLDRDADGEQRERELSGRDRDQRGTDAAERDRPEDRLADAEPRRQPRSAIDRAEDAADAADREHQADLAAAEPEFAAHQQDDDRGAIAEKRFDVAVQNATARMRCLVPDESKSFADVVHEARARTVGALRSLARRSDRAPHTRTTRRS